MWRSRMGMRTIPATPCGSARTPHAQLLPCTSSPPTWRAGRGQGRSRQYRRHGLSRRLRAHLRAGLAFGLAHRRRAAGLSRRLLRTGHRDRAGARRSTTWAIRQSSRTWADQRNLRAGDRLRADRRPLHHGRQDGGAGLQAVLRFRADRALPLRHLSRARPDGRQIRRRNGRQFRARARGRACPSRSDAKLPVRSPRC